VAEVDLGAVGFEAAVFQVAVAVLGAAALRGIGNDFKQS
jgi:hypothetical protein